jgi:hypothetical protein
MATQTRRIIEGEREACMGMLSRYQKSGGFLQLLNLIETCGPQKQEKFLNMIDEEDPRWSDAIRKRMLSIKRIFSWNQEILAEIVVRLPELTIGVALHGLDDESREKFLAMLSHSQKRKIEEHYDSKSPSPGEISATFVKIIEEVRSMLTQGYLRPDQFDADLTIEEDIEDKIMESFVASSGGADNGAGSSDTPTPDMSGLSVVGSDAKNADVVALKKQIIALNNENTQLKSMVRRLEDKLSQIRKIA